MEKMSDKMLSLRHIHKIFDPGTPGEKEVFKDFSLDVDRGDFITIIGSNGAGKSTLFNLIAGTFLTDRGEIFLDGENITMMPDHKRSRMIGRLFQDPLKGTAPGMTIEENLALAAGKGGWLSSIDRALRNEFRERIALLQMGLEDRMQSPVGLLSGGQRQALTLMMATFNAPKLLLLDEHTAALDPATSEKVMEITNRTVKENNLTCLMITHNMEAALHTGNRTLMMSDGHIVVDISGHKREGLKVDDLLGMFSQASGHMLDNDRILLGEKGH